MKNLDVLLNQKKELLEKMRLAAKAGKEEDFSNAFTELIGNIEERVINIANESVQKNDSAILSGRGIRQLTSQEKEYYNKFIEAAKSTNPQQALKDLEVVMPYTVIDNVLEDLRQNHPLLSEIEFMPTKSIVKMLVNKHGMQKALWGKINSEIVKEIMSNFDEIDAGLCKLTAFIPVSKDMLELGPDWVDTYVREILYEATACSLEEGIIVGSGKDMPVGMNRQVGENITIVGGVYPEKASVKLTVLNPEQLGRIIASMAMDEKGNPRIVGGLIFLVNPQDYYERVFPATTVLAPDGTYRNDVTPVPMKFIQSVFLDRGKAILGIPKRYFANVGVAPKEGRLEYDDSYRFLEDERIYTIKTHANGFPKDNNSFIVLDISGLKPRFVPVELHEPTPSDNNAKLAALSLGSASLTPVFSPEVKTYTAKTNNARNTINAISQNAEANTKVTFNGKDIMNGSLAEWVEENNEVSISVQCGTAAEVYTVTVTKEAA